MRRVLFFLVLAVFASIGAAAYYLSDANRLKPQLIDYLEAQTKLEIEIEGDLSWQLFPPLTLTATDITLSDARRTTHTKELSLNVDASAAWQDVQRWRVDSFTLTETTLYDKNHQVTISSFNISDFTIGAPAPFSLQGNYLQRTPESDSAARVFSAQGMLTYAEASSDKPQRLSFSKTQIDTEEAKAICDIDLMRRSSNTAQPDTRDDTLLPVQALASTDAIADCLFSTITTETATFDETELKFTNMDGKLNVFVSQPKFFTGQAIIEVDVDLTSQPLRWRVIPELEGVDSQQFLTWLNNDAKWLAAFAFTSEAQFSGNTREELYTTISADHQFDGGQGTIDIRALREQLQQVTTLTNDTQYVADWPDQWEYTNFTARGTTRGRQQTFDILLDNVTIHTNGTIDYATQNVDMLTNVTVSAPIDKSPIKVGSLIEDTPLPMRCTGAVKDVKCKVDADAVQAMIARALTSDGETGLKRKLERKIEEEVPEEYRDAARNLLDILGRALQDSQ